MQPKPPKTTHNTSNQYSVINGHKLLYGSWLFSCIFILQVLTTQAQKADHQHRPKQWLLTVEAGSSVGLAEYSYDLSSLDKEFSHQPGLAASLSLARTLGTRWELGGTFSFNQLRGNSPSPEFSANGIHHEFMELYNQPVSYQTESTSALCFIRYYFKKWTNKGPGKGLHLNPFIKAGVGYNRFKTQLNYDQTPPGAANPVIYKKGQGYNKLPGSSAQYSLGTGTRLSVNNGIDFLLSFTMDMINSDCIDAVHNYRDNGEAYQAFTVIPSLKLGVSIPLNREVSPFERYMPWAPN